MKIGIVVVAYNNVDGLSRLLYSLSNSLISSNVDLIISIDFGGSVKVKTIAEQFEWKYGRKIVNCFESNLGLKKHILTCGKYMDDFDWDASIVLEDDVYLSPFFYDYAIQCFEKYHDNENIAGVSLYKHEFNIHARSPFVPEASNSDVFFMQYAQSWGQVWFKKAWRDFVSWLENEKYELMNPQAVPQYLNSWKNSWLKYHIMYLIDSNRYFVYPYISYSTNFSDAGEHNQKSNAKMQVQLCYFEKKLTLVDFSDGVKYDAFFERCHLSNLDDEYQSVVVDLYGMKPVFGRYYLSSKVLPYKVVKSYGLCLRPIEKNIEQNIGGNIIRLYDLSEKGKRDSYNGNEIFEYNLKGMSLFNKRGLRYLIFDFFERVKLALRLFKKRFKRRKKK